jgi:hypothetical protein
MRMFPSALPDAGRGRSREAERASLMQCQDAGEKIQLKGRIRRTLVLDAFPRQPQLGFVQERSSFANIFIASASERDTLPHFF